MVKTDPRSAYVKVLESLESELADVASGRLPLPLVNAEAPFTTYSTLPPALIPLWSTPLPSYVGVWRHWFVPRAPTFVEIDLEEGPRVREIARSTQQLALIVCARALTSGGSKSPALAPFAKALGADLTAVRRLKTDRPEVLRRLPQFGKNAPLECFDEDDVADYLGDFPVPSAVRDPARVGTWAGMELDEAERTERQEWSRTAPWLLSETQTDVFEACLKKDDFAGAWLSLNSPGWSDTEIAAAMRALDKRAADPSFSRVVRAWSATSGEGGY